MFTSSICDMLNISIIYLCTQCNCPLFINWIAFKAIVSVFSSPVSLMADN